MTDRREGVSPSEGRMRAVEAPQVVSQPPAAPWAEVGLMPVAVLRAAGQLVAGLRTGGLAPLG